MKKLLEFFKSQKKILLIAVLLVAFILLAFLLYGGKNKVTSAVNTDTNKTVTEIKLTNILSGIDGVGQTEVMINEGEGVVQGVIIVCEGANSLMTRNDILNAVSTALNVNKNNIAIYAMNK